MQHLSFWVWIISPNTTFSRSIHLTEIPQFTYQLPQQYDMFVTVEPIHIIITQNSLFALDLNACVKQFLWWYNQKHDFTAEYLLFSTLPLWYLA